MYANADVVSHRPGKQTVNAWKPYHFLHESEPDADGIIRSVNTVFLTNRECPFKCVFCDLWKHTLDGQTPKGAIPAQIRYALERLPKAEVIKLYNSGNFFDVNAIPSGDYPEIASLISGYKRVIVENHPRIGRKNIIPFKELIDAKLEIAIGIETVHPEVLPKLNKKVSVRDIEEAARFCINNGIDLRGFILFNPPFITDPFEIRHWCLEAVKFAFDNGFSAVTIIPVRTGNGLMEVLEKQGDYVKPALSDLEDVFDAAMHIGSGRVFLDTWDLEVFSDTPGTFFKRKERIEKMNLSQRVSERAT